MHPSLLRNPALSPQASLVRSLCSSLVALVALVGVASSYSSAQAVEKETGPAARQALARDIFRELIEINTTPRMGSAKAAEAMAVRLKAAGFPESDIQLLGPQPESRNLVVRLRGKGSRQPILFIAHLDVVEALRQDWSLDPFTFVEKDGYFYGRGTTDMKGDAAALISALVRFKQEGRVPERDIIVALTDHEEGGGTNGLNWLLEHHRELLAAEYCINPDGGEGRIQNGKHTMLDVQTSEKTYVSFELEVTNKGGHSSLPIRDNAIYRLAAGLSRLAAYDFPVRLNETTRMFLERSALQETGQTKADILSILKTPSDPAAVQRLAGSSAFYNAMLRTTCVATLLSAGHAENALPQKALATVNARVMPGESAEAVMKTLVAVLADDQIKVTCKSAGFETPLSPLREDVMKPVERIAAAMWPGVIITPIMATGATDGRYLRRAGIPVYGVTGMFGDIDDVRAHGRDERIGVKEFYEGVDFLYELMKATSG